MYLAGVGNAAGVANTVPGTTTGLPAGVIAYNNNVIGPTWGIAYDSRFIPRDPFSTYATYDDPIRNEQYPPVSTAKNQGWSTTFDWSIAENLGLKLIVADHEISGQYSHDQDESPLPLFNVWGPVVSDESSFESAALGNRVQRPLRLDRRRVLLGSVSNQRRSCLAAVLRASVPHLRYRGHERRREQRYLLPLDHGLDRSIVVDGRTALVGRRQDLHVQPLLRRDRARGRRVGRLEARARLSAQRYGDGLLLERVRVHGEHVQRPAVHACTVDRAAAGRARLVRGRVQDRFRGRALQRDRVPQRLQRAAWPAYATATRRERAAEHGGGDRAGDHRRHRVRGVRGVSASSGP